MAVNDDANAIDKFVYFDQNFGVPSFASVSSPSLHGRHQLEQDFAGAEMMADLDHHSRYYTDPNIDTSILGVNNNIMYDASFAAIDIPSTQLNCDLEGNVSVTTASMPVVDAVASSAVNATMNDMKVNATELQHRSNAASPIDDKKSCTCKDCGKVFNSVWYLKQHAVKHSSERPFKCKYCHKTYRFRSNLYQHKCPLRDRASELALASVGVANGTMDGDELRKTSSSAVTNSPHPSSESSSSAEIAGANVARTRKRRAWPPLTSPTGSTALAANGFDKQCKGKVRKLNQHGGDFSTDGATVSAANRCAISVSSSAGSPLSLSSLMPGSTKHGSSATLSEEDIQKFLDRHKDKLHKCPRCKSLWPSREYLTRHMEWHNDDSSRFRCVHCSETFVDEQRYGLHKQNHSPSSLHVCARCRGKFSTRVALKKHIRRCSLVDAKNNSVTTGQIQQRLNTVTNGYRHMLFIDPTPPPSPTISGNGAMEAHHDNGSAEENKNVSNAAPVEEVSPTSLGENGMVKDPDMHDGGLLSSAGTVLSSGRSNGVLTPAANGATVNNVATAMATITETETENEALIDSSDVMLSGDNDQTSEAVLQAILPSEGANTPIGDCSQLPWSAVKRTRSTRNSFSPTSIPMLDVPENNLFPFIYPLVTSNVPRSLFQFSHGSATRWSSSFHSSGGEDLFSESEFLHNDGGLETANGGTVLCDRIYHRGGTEPPNMDNIKAAVRSWQDEYLMPAPMRADTPSVAFGAVTPVDTTPLYKDTVSRRLLIGDEDHNFEALTSEVPTDFGAEGSYLLSAAVSTVATVLLRNRIEKQYSNPMQATVPFDVSQLEESGNDRMTGTGSLPELNQVHSRAIECGDVQISASQHFISRATLSEVEGAHDQRYYCESCGCSSADEGSCREDWLRKHHASCAKKKSIEKGKWKRQQSGTGVKGEDQPEEQGQLRADCSVTGEQGKTEDEVRSNDTPGASDDSG